MTTPFTAAVYMEKAQRALEGACSLLKAGDAEGACSRAYYAMFNAAHAALRAAEIETPHSEIKTHRGLVSVFGKELILTKRIETDLSKSLNQVQHLRQAADYSANLTSLDQTRWAV